MLEEIQRMRLKMIDSAEKNGLTDEGTIRYSQELDQLIYQYQRIMQISSNHQQEVKFIFGQMILVWPKSLVKSVNLLH